MTWKTPGRSSMTEGKEGILLGGKPRDLHPRGLQGDHWGDQSSQPAAADQLNYPGE